MEIVVVEMQIDNLRGKKKQEFVLEYRRQVIWNQLDVKLPTPPGPEIWNRMRVRRLS